jgi:Spy/CpxP family protein refolding chaperone
LFEKFCFTLLSSNRNITQHFIIYSHYSFKKHHIKMKRIVLALMIALMGTTVVIAQPHRRSDMTPEQMVEKRVERLDKALSLTAEQKAEITKIYSQEMQTMGKDKPAKKERGERPDEATMKARREQMKAQQDATRAQIEALLTPEQAENFAQMKQHDRDGRHGPKQHERKAMTRDDGCKDCSSTCKKDK